MPDELPYGCIPSEGVFCAEADHLWAELEEAYRAGLHDYADGGRYRGTIERFRAHCKITPAGREALEASRIREKGQGDE